MNFEHNPTNEQREMLDYIWREYVATDDWPKVSKVVCYIGSYSLVKEWYEELDPGVISETHGKGGKKVLRLTFLGVLQTSYSESLVENLRRFLIIVKKQIESDGDTGAKLPREFVLKEVGLSTKDETPLIRMLETTGWQWGAINGEEDNWFFKIWDGGLELIDIPRNGIKDYIISVALRSMRQTDYEADPYLEKYESDKPPDGSEMAEEKDHRDQRHYRYEVALSFAGEQRDYVRAVYEILKNNRISTFFDEANELALWGEDLGDFFDEVFRKQSRYCVMFISKEYAEKSWTNHERKSALSRAVDEKSAYVLPARFDDTELKGLRPTVKYIDLKKYSDPVEFAKLIIDKVRLSAKYSISSEVQNVDENPGSQVVDDMQLELTGILISMKQYADEFDRRDIKPGTDQLKEAFEVGCDDIRGLQKNEQLSASQYSDKLAALSDQAESISVYESYLGRESYEEFKSMISNCVVLIDDILSSVVFETLDDSSLIDELREILEKKIHEFSILTKRISSSRSELLYKRIYKYQEDISILGMNIYRIGYYLGESEYEKQGKRLMEIGMYLHLVETINGELHPRSVFEVFDELEEYCTELNTIQKNIS